MRVDADIPSIVFHIPALLAGWTIGYRYVKDYDKVLDQWTIIDNIIITDPKRFFQNVILFILLQSKSTEENIVRN